MSRTRRSLQPNSISTWAYADHPAFEGKDDNHLVCFVLPVFTNKGCTWKFAKSCDAIYIWDGPADDVLCKDFPIEGTDKMAEYIRAPKNEWAIREALKMHGMNPSPPSSSSSSAVLPRHVGVTNTSSSSASSSTQKKLPRTSLPITTSQKKTTKRPIATTTTTTTSESTGGASLLDADDSEQAKSISSASTELAENETNEQGQSSTKRARKSDSSQPTPTKKSTSTLPPVPKRNKSNDGDDVTHNKKEVEDMKPIKPRMVTKMTMTKPTVTSPKSPPTARNTPRLVVPPSVNISSNSTNTTTTTTSTNPFIQALSRYPSTVFSGYAFVLSGAAIGRDDTLASFTGSQMEQLVKHHGGEVINSSQNGIHHSKPVLTVCHPKGYRMGPYVRAVAQGNMVLHPRWLVDSIMQATRLPLEAYALPPGIQLWHGAPCRLHFGFPTIPRDENDEDVEMTQVWKNTLVGIAIEDSTSRDLIMSIASAAGINTVDLLQDVDDVTECTHVVVLPDADLSSELLAILKHHLDIVVSVEWLMQSVLARRQLSHDEIPMFHWTNALVQLQNGQKSRKLIKMRKGYHTISNRIVRPGCVMETGDASILSVEEYDRPNAKPPKRKVLVCVHDFVWMRNNLTIITDDDSGGEEEDAFANEHNQANFRAGRVVSLTYVRGGAKASGWTSNALGNAVEDMIDGGLNDDDPLRLDHHRFVMKWERFDIDPKYPSILIPTEEVIESDFDLVGGKFIAVQVPSMQAAEKEMANRVYLTSTVDWRDRVYMVVRGQHSTGGGSGGSGDDEEEE